MDAWMHGVIGMMGWRPCEAWASKRQRHEKVTLIMPANKAYHLEAYIKRRVEETANLLDDDRINKYLFFGTDWPFSSASMGELKYKSYYDKDLSDTQKERYFKDNIAEFLFGPERKIPDNYIEFLKKILKAKAMDVSTIPWVKEMEDNKFRLVTDEDLHFHN